MRTIITACVLFGAMAETCFSQATLSEDSYWKRPLLKARSTSAADVSGDTSAGLFGDDDQEDSGLIVIQPDNGPAGTEVQTVAYAADGAGGTEVESESSGSLVFSIPFQAVTEGALIANQFCNATVATGDLWWFGFGQSFVLEAKHKLWSDTVATGTWKPCIFKCIIGWNGNIPVTDLYCNWVVVGFPGQPEVSTEINGGFVTVALNTGDEYNYVEYLSDPLEDTVGGIYVDIPGWLQIGDEVSWVSSQGTGTTNFSHGTGNWGAGPDQVAIATILEALLRLEVHDEE